MSNVNKPISHKWEPITDLPANYLSLSSADFTAKAKEWLALKPLIKDEVFSKFLDRIKNEWVIELGNVENIYFINDKLTETLVEEGLYSIELPHQGNSTVVVDPHTFFYSHEEVFNALYDMARAKTQISPYLIRGIHAVLTENQVSAPGIDPFGRKINIPLAKGIFKKWPNNPTTANGSIHQYCPPEQVDSEISRLLHLHEDHINKNVPIEIEAAWFHHRFIQIHPFQDGNGRVGRALTALIFIKNGLFPPIVKLNDKKKYLINLELADKDNLKPLIDYFSNLVASKITKCIEYIK
ncbi:MAG: Fic family protein [Deltaproteobacteria bacterium]|jgi:Fic family protein|nr:Fic family protein [Deltaproteobacteria bacterium]